LRRERRFDGDFAAIIAAAFVNNIFADTAAMLQIFSLRLMRYTITIMAPAVMSLSR